MRVRRKSDIRLSSVRASHVLCPDCPLSVFSRRLVLLRCPLNSQDNLFAVERVDFLRCGRPLVAGSYALPGLRVDQSTSSLERVSIISPCKKISSLLPLGRRAALASLGMLRSCLRHGFQGSSKACIFEELWKPMSKTMCHTLGYARVLSLQGLELTPINGEWVCLDLFRGRFSARLRGASPKMEQPRLMAHAMKHTLNSVDGA